jgi:hypothetical protein
MRDRTPAFSVARSDQVLSVVLNHWSWFRHRISAKSLA